MNVSMSQRSVTSTPTHRGRVAVTPTHRSVASTTKKIPIDASVQPPSTSKKVKVASASLLRYSLTHLLTHSLTRTYSLTQLLTHSLTHPPTYSLICIPT
jgi:hypothetical protein